MFACITILLAYQFFASALPTCASTSSLPIYAGSKVNLELNLSENDLLPAIKQTVLSFVPMWQKACDDEQDLVDEKNQLSKLTTPISIIDLEAVISDLQTAIKGLKKVQVVAYQLPPNIQSDILPNFYMQKLGLSKGWSSIIRIQDAGKVFRMYSKPNMEGLFILSVNYPRVVAILTDGKIDATKIGNIFAKIATQIMSSSADQQSQTSPPSANEEKEPQPEN
jgi:hypothetical protein